MQKSSEPLWSILIPTLFERSKSFINLMGILAPQMIYDDVEILVYGTPTRSSIGAKRNEMVAGAKGEFISFIDDDDEVPYDYVSTIRHVLREDDPDYVGFRLQLYFDGVAQKPTFHSLKYDNWHDDAQGYYRDFSHLNPIRRSFAIREPFEGNYGEDSAWSDRMRKFKSNMRETYIPHVMYDYYFDSTKSTFFTEG